MRINKPKITKIGKEKKKASSSDVLFIVLALVLTFALFIGLVISQNYLINDVSYQKILVAKQDIPVGKILDESNISEYVTEKEINILDVVDGNLNNTVQLLGKKAEVMLYAGEDITLKDFSDTNAYLDNIKDPIEFSFSVGNISESYGGKLRKGDYINITMSFEGNTRYVAENIYVSKALTSDGIELDASDTTGIANILYVIVDKPDEVSIKNLLFSGANLNISKPINQSSDKKTIIADASEIIKETEVEVINDPQVSTLITEHANDTKPFEEIEFVDDEEYMDNNFINKMSNMETNLEIMDETIATELTEEVVNTNTTTNVDNLEDVTTAEASTEE